MQEEEVAVSPQLMLPKEFVIILTTYLAEIKCITEQVQAGRTDLRAYRQEIIDAMIDLCMRHTGQTRQQVVDAFIDYIGIPDLIGGFNGIAMEE
jgi:hypothetical protein